MNDENDDDDDDEKMKFLNDFCFAINKMIHFRGLNPVHDIIFL